MNYEVKKVDFDDVDTEVRAIGQFISDAIDGRGLKKTKIAEAIEMSTNTISNCCKGNNPNIKTLLAIGRAIGLSPIEIVTREEGISFEMLDEDEAPEEKIEETVFEDDPVPAAPVDYIDDLELDEEDEEEVENVDDLLDPDIFEDESSIDGLIPDLRL